MSLAARMCLRPGDVVRWDLPSGARLLMEVLQARWDAVVLRGPWGETEVSLANFEFWRRVCLAPREEAS